jgi:hypothetical protein
VSRVEKLGALVVVVGSVAAACAQGGSSSRPAAASPVVALRVGGRPVTQATLRLLGADLRFRGKPVSARIVVGDAIDNVLVMQRAARQHITVPAAAIDRAFRAAGGKAAAGPLRKFGIPLWHLRERVAQSLLTRRLIGRQFGAVGATDRQLRRRYRRDRAKFHTPLLVRVSAIQVRGPVQGRTVLRLLRHGRGFDALARQLSIDPAVQSQGPDQGWKAPGLLAPVVGRVLRSTLVGHVAQTLVRIQTSYLVVKITARRPARTAPYREVRGAIRRVLDEELRVNAFHMWLKRARRSADITYVTIPDPWK